MLKVDSNTKASGGNESPSEASTNAEDKLSLLVKAAEKLVDEEQKSNRAESTGQLSESDSILRLNAFVNSLKEAKNAQNLIFIGKNGKPTRPFKAYPKESLSLPIGGQTTSFLDEANVSATSSCSSSPVAAKTLLSTEGLLSLMMSSDQNVQDTKLFTLANKIRQNDLTSLNLNDLTTFDFTSVSFTPHDFCVQHRKRIQQAQERILKKTESNGHEPKRRNSTASKKRGEQAAQNGTDSSNHDEYMNYPPKKRHRIQQLESLKLSHEDEANSSNSSQTEGKCETPAGSPASSSAKPVDSAKTSVRSRQSSADDMDKDEAYKERRRKNNEAAKRSRDARRAKEDDIALRAALLERENLQLKVELAQLKQETTRLRCLLYNS